MRLESGVGREHPSGGIATFGGGEAATGHREQFAPPAANVQPTQRLRLSANSLEKGLDQEPFPAVEVKWISGETIPDRIIEQIGVGRCKLVKFGSGSRCLRRFHRRSFSRRRILCESFHLPLRATSLSQIVFSAVFACFPQLVRVLDVRAFGINPDMVHVQLYASR